MSLKLYTHPLASYCQKVHVALYENETPFEAVVVDLGDPVSRAKFLKVWPVGKFPVLHDDAFDRVIPESTIIIEYLEQKYPSKHRLIPVDPDLALQTRLQDRFFDLHVHEHMQKIVGNKLRPAASKDPHGVEQAEKALLLAYSLIDQQMSTRTWSAGESFSMGDCAAAPALYYANLVLPIAAEFPNTKKYWSRLMERPSFVRVVTEAKPYFHMFPG